MEYEIFYRTSYDEGTLCPKRQLIVQSIDTYLFGIIIEEDENGMHRACRGYRGLRYNGEFSWFLIDNYDEILSIASEHLLNDSPNYSNKYKFKLCHQFQR